MQRFPVARPHGVFQAVLPDESRQPIDSAVKFEQFRASGRIQLLDMSNLATQMAGEVGMLLTILIGGTVPNAVRQDCLQPVIFWASDVSPFVDHNSGHRLALIVADDSSLGHVHSKAFVTNDSCDERQKDG